MLHSWQNWKGLFPSCCLDLLWIYIVLFFDNKDIFDGSFYYSKCKFDRANDELNWTRRFETSPNCCHQERFQMFITTPIGVTSTNFVVKRDLQNFGSTCGSLRKSSWRYDMKNTQPHLNHLPTTFCKSSPVPWGKSRISIEFCQQISFYCIIGIFQGRSWWMCGINIFMTWLVCKMWNPPRLEVETL